jgi:4-aminobutyrate aminotransferase-like enzyme
MGENRKKEMVERPKERKKKRPKEEERKEQQKKKIERKTGEETVSCHQHRRRLEPPLAITNNRGFSR